MDSILSSTAQNALTQAAHGKTLAAAKQVEAARETKDYSQFDKAAEDFEAVFISEMIKPMFEGISSDGMFGGGKGEEVFRDMLVQEYGKIMARTGSVGIAGPVKEAMINMQEQADNATTQTP